MEVESGGGGGGSGGHDKEFGHYPVSRKSAEQKNGKLCLFYLCFNSEQKKDDPNEWTVDGNIREECLI